MSTYVILFFCAAFHGPSFSRRKPEGLHCPCGWLLQNVALQFHDLPAEGFSLCLYSAIYSDGCSLERIVPQNCSPPESLHSAFSLPGHHLLSLVIQLLPPQLFLDCIRTVSPLAYLHCPFSSALSCLLFLHYSTLNPGSIFLVRLWLRLQLPLPLVLLSYSWGKNNSTYCMFTSGCQENPEKKCATWRTSIRDYLPQLGSTRLGSLLCFFRVFCFPYICKHHFKSLFLSSNLLAFSLSYSLFSEKIETIWWNNLNFLPTNLQTNLLLYPLSFLPSCYYSMKVFLLISKVILHLTPSRLLRTSVLSHSSIFKFFVSSMDPGSCRPHLSSTFSLPIYHAIPSISHPLPFPCTLPSPPCTLLL